MRKGAAAVDSLHLDENLLPGKCSHEEVRVFRTSQRGFHLDESPPLNSQQREGEKLVKSLHGGALVVEAAQELSPLGLLLFAPISQFEGSVQCLRDEARL
jgi:hypothetical protein